MNMKVKVKKVCTMTNELWQDLNDQQTEKVVGGNNPIAFILLYSGRKLSS
jgi:hypothetical protein